MHEPIFLQERIKADLEALRNPDGLKQLIWSTLNYRRINRPISRHGWSKQSKDALAEEPLYFAAAGINDDFRVIYGRLQGRTLSLNSERSVVTQLLRLHPYSLFIFSNESQDKWHFVNVRYDAKVDNRRIFRRISVASSDELRTASERLAMINAANFEAASALEIQIKHDEAFNVEAVTETFFNEYVEVFGKLQTFLSGKLGNKRAAHDYSLQFLNRLMFLYFVQRKGLFRNERDFLKTFWTSYKSSEAPKNTFCSEWLKPFFLEAFNNNKRKSSVRPYSEGIRRVYEEAPYLNGGLFRKNSLDELCEKKGDVSDDLFESALSTFNRFNFTIAEDTPLDQEVAVDPEMIGRVYESLVNIEERGDDVRADAGIFYTPRPEIDLMCRLALVDNLANHLGTDNKKLFYEVVFALEQEEKDAADKALKAARLWDDVRNRLMEITVLDPACGSGSFLVGMLQILNDLLERAEFALGLERSGRPFIRKKRIIQKNLFGVDVMEWACHVAELRLWLALITDPSFDPRSMTSDLEEPLLPHFTFKIRHGDSLVQEIGKIDIGHIGRKSFLKGGDREAIEEFKKKKSAYFKSNPDANTFKDSGQALRSERVFFAELVQNKAREVDRAIKELEKGRPARIQLDVWSGETVVDSAESAAAQERLRALRCELEEIQGTLKDLSGDSGPHFAWDVAFVEVFDKPDAGFDIVVGNPPYVRQEKIGSALIPDGRSKKALKKQYKEKLADNVYQLYPAHFQYDPLKRKAKDALSAMSDLYVYFFFLGLSLLNSQGSFSFITSNAWLDVAYGADLQEFLLRRCHVKLVLDSTHRVFKDADVNTVITLISAPTRIPNQYLGAVARFVLFRIPFEAIYVKLLAQIENLAGKTSSDWFRAFPVAQEVLLQEGQRVEDEGTEDSSPARSGPLIQVPRYVGNKWGGKYLKAPDIYWELIESKRSRLVSLRSIAEIRRGFTTGANDFFYLDEKKIGHWGIEKRFLHSVVKSPTECKQIVLSPKDLDLKILNCNASKKELKGTAALKYIEWGESQEFDNRPTCRGRERWWSLAAHENPTHLWQKSVNDRHVQSLIPFPALVDQRLYELSYQRSPWSLAVVLNCSLLVLFKEVAGRTNLGEGALDTAVYEANDILVVDPLRIDESDARRFLSRNVPEAADIREEIKGGFRQELDEFVFDALQLSKAEKEAVHEAVFELVNQRLKKAASLREAA